MIDLDEHDRLIKLLAQCEKTETLPEEVAIDFRHILDSYEKGMDSSLYEFYSKPIDISKKDVMEV